MGATGSLLGIPHMPKLKMVQKRPFEDGESYEIASKHPKQMEHISHLPASPEIVPSEFGKYHTSGKVVISEYEAGNNLTDEVLHEYALPVHASIPADYYKPDRSIRALLQEEIYTALLDHPSRKPVSIGPEFQADIPEWGSDGQDKPDSLQGSETVTLPSQAAGFSVTVADDPEKELSGMCVIPMPDVDSSVWDCEDIGHGRIECSCLDAGSERCVRQHVAEAREKLRRTLGHEKFVDLGFDDMGEEVVQKWSEEEDNLFHEVVFSNPASLGRNFWDNLFEVFPFRAKMEIVNYYFNVFMLQKRAGQNRIDTMDIDSDNDEWQGNDDYGNDEDGMSEEDEDSVVETIDDSGYVEGNGHDLNEYDEDDPDETGDKRGHLDLGDCAETYRKKILDECGPDPAFQFADSTAWDERENPDTQDESCTSSDTGASVQECHVRGENCKQWLGSFDCGNHEFALEPCDPREWDVGYLARTKSDVEFLPTCMIEEVFGDGACNFKGRDGKGMSK
ncbi:hypothetical protein RJ641_009404 [Dillenia turbinata]|uniref:Myb-like domain-containing protein n=1 Tax=Dillenia turbinata TaxID=194707 RepID=A0AAN8VCC4_9MAGN